MQTSTPFILLLLLSVLTLTHGQCQCPSTGIPVCCQPARGPARLFPNACECTCVPGNVMLPFSACPAPTADPSSTPSATTAAVVRTPPPRAVARTPPPQAPRTLEEFITFSPCALLRCPRGYFCTTTLTGADCRPIPSASGPAPAPTVATDSNTAQEDSMIPNQTPIAVAATAEPDMPDFSDVPEPSSEFFDFGTSCVCTREINFVCCQTEAGTRTLPNPCTCDCFNGTIISRNRC